jgi:RimJ/RimL family protein N-acetyltransferase
VAATKSFTWGSRLPVLQTPRLTIRPLSESDVAEVFAVFSDPIVMRYWDGALMKSLDDAMRYIDHIHHGFRRRELFQWGIADSATHAVLGTCTLTQVSTIHQRAEIGFALHFHRLEADVDPRNERSIRLLDRLGFTREGQLRERYFMNGERQDAIVMGLLHREWSSAARLHENH